jgi:uncharacterized membrane protein YqhA
MKRIIRLALIAAALVTIAAFLYAFVHDFGECFHVMGLIDGLRICHPHG